MWRPGSTTQIFLGIACGVLLGLTMRQWAAQPWTDRELMYLQFPGELFLRMVNCLILPLVITSIVSASSRLNESGGIGLKALVYYITTTSAGIVLSVVLSLTIRPGQWGSVEDTNSTTAEPEVVMKFVTLDTILDLIRNLFPDNLVQACLSQVCVGICILWLDTFTKNNSIFKEATMDDKGIEIFLAINYYQTVLLEPKPNASGEKVEISVYDMGISHEYTAGTNVLGLVFSGLVFGLVLGSMDETRRLPLQDFFQSLAAATAEIIDWVIKAAPIAVIFLISSKILRSQESGGMEFARLGIFVLTVFAGLAVQALLVLPLIYFACTRQSPYKIMMRMGPALVTAFGTSSSTATVPTTIRCLDKLGVDRQVSRFIAPIGATINMDGIALYETVGALFIMQMRGMDLSLVQTVAISIMCTLSCIGAAGMPSGGYAMLIMVLNSLGIPAEDVALIIAVDSFVDRFRTMINIVADSLGAGIISELIKKEKQRDLRSGKTYEMVHLPRVME